MRFLRRLICGSKQRRNKEGEMRNEKRKEKYKIRLPNFLRRNSKTPSVETPNIPESESDGQSEQVLTFEENLQRRRFSEAGRQLIGREERLFGLNQEGAESTREDEAEMKDKLAQDYEALFIQIWMTVGNSLSGSEEEEQEALKGAIRAILQEEEQDKCWEGLKLKEHPRWRPRHCRDAHDSQLQKIVENQLDTVELGEGPCSSVQKDILGMGRQLKRDLLEVARRVKCCYPADMGVCQLYARLYHQAFSARLMIIAEYELVIDDCFQLLHWANHHYPSILREKELMAEVDYESLGPLLSEEVLKPLAEQYLSHKELEVKTQMHRALRMEEQAWKGGALPELNDECYFCHLANDVIQCLDGALKSARSVLGDETKARRITSQLRIFLSGYKKYFEEVIKDNHGNTKAVIMANLLCVEQFGDYIVRNADLFPEEESSCMSLLSSMRDCGYGYFTSPMHEDLKVMYRRLGSEHLLQERTRVCEELLERVDTQIHNLSTLHNNCLQELLSRLHVEVMVEYVRRLMKRKIRLRNREQQERAARVLCEDSRRIHTLFTEAGSKMEWLSGILPKLAELLKLQDPVTVQLEMATLAKDYPDLSEWQVSALLHLKANLSSSDLKKIKNAFSDSRDPKCSQTMDASHPTKVFFSRVKVK